MMSLQPYLPPAASGDAGAVYALLQVISDPAAAKKALDKMVEERKAIDNATQKQAEQFKTENEKLAQARAEVEKTKRTADVIASKAMNDLNDAKAKLQEADRKLGQCTEMEKQTAKQRTEVEEHAVRLAQAEKTLDANYRSFKAAQSEQERQEAKLKQREDDLAMREKTLAADIAEHNQWLAGLKPPRAR